MHLSVLNSVTHSISHGCTLFLFGWKFNNIALYRRFMQYKTIVLVFWYIFYLLILKLFILKNCRRFIFQTFLNLSVCPSKFLFIWLSFLDSLVCLSVVGLKLSLLVNWFDPTWKVCPCLFLWMELKNLLFETECVCVMKKRKKLGKYVFELFYRTLNSWM